MPTRHKMFSTRTGIIVVGAVIGIGAALLQYFGNPPIVHNFATASSAKGVGAFGPAAVIIRLAFCLIIGFTHRDRIIV